MKNLFSKSKVGDIITLQKQDLEVVRCIKTGKLMVNIDADEVMPGDLITLKRRGVLLSNPETEEDICIEYEFPKTEDEEPTFGERLSRWFEDDDDDDDSGFFTTTTTSTPTFGGSSGFGGFGGFGGGSFSGGGASRGF